MPQQIHSRLPWGPRSFPMFHPWEMYVLSSTCPPWKSIWFYKGADWGVETKVVSPTVPTMEKLVVLQKVRKHTNSNYVIRFCFQTPEWTYTKVAECINNGFRQGPVDAPISKFLDRGRLWNVQPHFHVYHNHNVWSALAPSPLDLDQHNSNLQGVERLKCWKFCLRDVFVNNQKETSWDRKLGPVDVGVTIILYSPGVSTIPVLEPLLDNLLIRCIPNMYLKRPCTKILLPNMYTNAALYKNHIIKYV